MKKIAQSFLMTLVFSVFCFGQSSGIPPASENENDKGFSETQAKRERPVLKLSRGLKRSIEKKRKKLLKSKKTESSAADDDVIRIDSNLVTIPVSVYDRNGLYVSDLCKENFKVFEDDEEHEIAYFGITDKPIYVVLVIDVSPSANYKIQEIRASAKAFVRKLRPEDQVMIIRFDRNQDVLTEFTKDREKIDSAIDKTKFGLGTAVYDAIDFTINKKLAAIDGRKAIVLFSDGIDTKSRNVSFDDSLYVAEESSVLIFPVYFNTYKPDRNKIVKFLFKGLSLEDSQKGEKYVTDLAELTGGKVMVADSEADGLTEAFESIAEELRRQYYLGYYPKKDGEIGEHRQIKVRVNRPNLAIRSREGYTITGNSTPK